MNEVRPRLWPLLLIGVLAIVGWIAVWTGDASDRQSQVLSSIAVGILAGLLAVLWLLLLSRLPWRRRLAGFGVVVLAAALVAALVEVRGVTGDFLPILAWRWAGEGDPNARSARSVAPVTTGDDDWPGLYGAGRDATLDGPALASWEDAEPRELWRREVGPSWSSVAIVGGDVFTLEQHGPREVLARYRASDGEPVWSIGWSARYDTTVAGIGPRSTPTFDAGRVYAFGGTGRLVAVDAASGEIVWERDAIEDGGGDVPDWGMAQSPLTVDGLVVVSGGIPRESSGKMPDGPTGLLAYAAEDGELVWRAGDDRPSYSSPIVATLAGQPQIVAFNQGSLSGHRVDDGELLWSTPWRAGQPNCASPVVLPGDRLLVSTGYGVGSALFRIEGNANGSFSATELWKGPRLKSKFANVLLRGNTLFGLDDGRFVALDVETGERRWKRGRYGHGQTILVEDRIIVQAEDGRVILLAADPEQHRELGVLEAFDSKTWNPPALSDRLLIVRNDREMAAYELPLESL